MKNRRMMPGTMDDGDGGLGVRHLKTGDAILQDRTNCMGGK